MIAARMQHEGEGGTVRLGADRFQAIAHGLEGGFKTAAVVVLL